MYAADHQDTVVALDGIPPHDAGAPMPAVFCDELNLFLAYWLAPAGEERTILKFASPRAHYFGPPNDETLHGHPLWSHGLRQYGIFEITSSSWIRSLERMNHVHPRHNPERYKELRHYVFTFHDSTFECIAKDVAVARLLSGSENAQHLMQMIADLSETKS